MRQIAFDTETTGLSTEEGHRIIEIGCVELIDRKITGDTFHRHVNPDREVDSVALEIHGISNHFLRDKPKFKEILEDLIQYIDGSELIIHNAPFDVGFLNYEFNLAGHNKLVKNHCVVFDTLPFARKLRLGRSNTLKALCKYYGIDDSHRKLHGALLDADLLARVYLAMTGGQTDLFSESEQSMRSEHKAEINPPSVRNKRLPVMTVSPEEEDAHLKFVEILKTKGGPSTWE
jgi:DNA polymerase III subunit epsilon